MSLIANGRIDTLMDHRLDNATDFFPSVSVTDIRDYVRIDSSVTDFRLSQIVAEETLDVMRLLASLTDKAGRLTDLSDKVIDGKNAMEIWYFSAIANGVAAKITEKYRNYNTTNKHADKALDHSPTIDEYRRNKMWALSQLLGRSQTVVELI